MRKIQSSHIPGWKLCNASILFIRVLGGGRQKLNLLDVPHIIDRKNLDAVQAIFTYVESISFSLEDLLYGNSLASFVTSLSVHAE